jgi:molybdopterin-guanine dinucleotide biosynthesis protein A
MPSRARTKPSPEIEIWILAGGLSQRMGRDKSRIRLGSRTLLGHVRHAAMQTGLPVHVLRKDALPRCGPVGGVWTALKKSPAEALLFLPCDMPLITPAVITDFAAAWRAADDSTRAMFVTVEGKIGFPFVLAREVSAVVTRLLEDRHISIRGLARPLNATTLNAPSHWREHLVNVNTPEDLARLG